MDGPARLPLRGREREVAALRQCLGQTQAGTGQVIIIDGSAGQGKTRLLEECARIATDLGFSVGQGTTQPGRLIELGALFDALFEGEVPLADRRKLKDDHASQEFLFWLLQDLQAIIEEAALLSPLLICLDDLHRATSVCAVAMRQLTQRLASLPVAWVMAFRPEQGLLELQGAKQELVASGAQYLRLRRLSRDAVAEVAADVLEGSPDAGLLQKVERVDGNAFLLVDFCRGLQDDQLISVDSGRLTLVQDRLPHRVSESMKARLARMSPTASRAATFASGLGASFTLHDLSIMTNVPLTELIDPVQELVDGDLFAENGNQLAFRHDLIREAVRGSLLAPVRRALDRQAVDVLLSRGALPAEVALQLVDSAELGDDQAISILHDAAHTLAISNPVASAELASKALELAPLGHPLRGALAARRVLSLFAAGQCAEGKQLADSTLREALPVEEEARVRFSVASMFDLPPRIRADSARAGLALPNVSGELRAMLWGVLYHSLTTDGRVSEALDIESNAREAVYATDSQGCWLTFDLPHAGLTYQLLDFGRALEIVNQAERYELARTDDARKRLLEVTRVWILDALDRYEEADEALEIGVVAAQQDRQNWAQRYFETTFGRLMIHRGRLAEARVALEGRFTLRDVHLVTDGPQSSPVVAQGYLHIHTGDELSAVETAEIAKVMVRSEAPSVRKHGSWYLALLALSQGDPMQAHSWLCASGYDDRLSMWPFFPHDATYDVERVRIAAAVADEELAEHTIAVAERRVALNPDVRSVAAAAAHTRGVWEGSIDQLERATLLYRDVPRPLAYASALEDLGRLRAQHGQNDAAIEALDHALVIATGIGAAWDAARLRGRLRRLGVRRRPAAPSRPRTGWASLTDAESAVATLAAQGSTNREIANKLFVTPHTVNTHLRHIFEKLGVNSRMQLLRASSGSPRDPLGGHRFE
jgi:DNA-binding CsgD family transcriptional regulator